MIYPCLMHPWKKQMTTCNNSVMEHETRNQFWFTFSWDKREEAGFSALLKSSTENILDFLEMCKD